MEEQKVYDWSGKPITNDTATADILGRWGGLNNITVKYKGLMRNVNDRKYYWTIIVNNEIVKRVSVSATRKACLNGNLFDLLRE